MQPDHEDCPRRVDFSSANTRSVFNMAVEGANQLIVATEVSSNASRVRQNRSDAASWSHEVQRQPMGNAPGSVLADAGYCKLRPTLRRWRRTTSQASSGRLAT